MDKILITGANGFIGKSLSAFLKAKYFNVVSMASSDGDIADPETIKKINSNNISHVFHLAGKTYVPDSWNNASTFYQTNLLGTVNVLEFCKKNSVPITYTSAYVYGQPEHLPIKEDNLIRPNNPYALSKYFAEQICEFYASTYNLPVTIIRPFNVYGINQRKDFLIPSIISQVLNNEKIIVQDLLPKRDYIYIDDLLTALIATLRKTSGYHVYNIGSGKSLSVKEVISIIQAVAGTQKEVISNHTARSSEIMDVIADISLAKKELEWIPKYSFQSGIQNIIHTTIKRKYE